MARVWYAANHALFVFADEVRALSCLFHLPVDRVKFFFFVGYWREGLSIGGPKLKEKKKAGEALGEERLCSVKEGPQ